MGALLFLKNNTRIKFVENLSKVPFQVTKLNVLTVKALNGASINYVKRSQVESHLILLWGGVVVLGKYHVIIFRNKQSKIARK